MKIGKLIGLGLQEDKHAGYRTSDEIFGETQQNEGGIKQYRGILILPHHVRVEGGRNAYDKIKDACYRHFDAAYAGQGISYDYYEPAYRFGAELAASHTYGSRLWVEFEPHAQPMWEVVNPDTWQVHRAQVIHGWNLMQQLKIHTK